MNHAIIRRPELHEWFLAYQHDKLRKSGLFLPMNLDVDVTRIWNQFESRNEKVPASAIFVKAVSRMIERHPEVNRILFKGIWGMRIVEFKNILINFPLIVKDKNKNYLSATVLTETAQKSVYTIQDDILRATKRPISELPVGRWVFGKPNHFFNRLRLRFIHFLVHRIPSLYVRLGGGGVNVSSLLNNSHTEFQFTPHAYGPSTLTFCAASVSVNSEKKKTLHIGIGFDHTGIGGDPIIKALRTLSQILSAEDPADLDALTQ